MLRVQLGQARPGMELALPVTHPKSPDTVLLRRGYVLDGKTIGRLSELHARELWIRYPGMEFVGEHICPSIVESGQRLAAALSGAFDGVLPGGIATLEYGSYRRALQDLLERIAANPRAGLFVIDLASSHIPMSRSAGHGAFLALLLGLKLETYLMLSRSRLGYFSRDVSNLAMGALLRDVGLLALDPRERALLLARRDPADAAWRRHVTDGFDLVKSSVEPSAASAVLHHHQRFDGKGFPQRTLLSGEQQALEGATIHIFARLIAVADLFDAMRFPVSSDPLGPEPRGAPTVRALHRLLRGPESALVDPLVARALVHVAPPFPPGTIVRLSNGLRCAVIEWDPLDPCRPEVAVLDRYALDPGRFEEPRRRISLAQEEDLRIVEADGEDVRDDLFFPAGAHEFDIARAQSAMISRPIETATG